MTNTLRPTDVPVTAAHGRVYFGLQALLGAAWWAGVFTMPGVRTATLGPLDPIVVAVFDIPLFVLASAAVAFGVRLAVWVVVPWTILVALGMTVYATVTTQAGLGAVAMIAAAVAGVIAGSLVAFGRVPSERLLVGPFAFRSSRTDGENALLMRTFAQLVCFWGVFLVILPWIIKSLEERWQLDVKFPFLVVLAGFALLVLASALGIWSAVTMARFGGGTPLPSAMPNRLVDDGPYRFVRNPMAVAGVVQGVAIGMFIESWLVIVYAIAGSLLWNWMIRPHEEADLRQRFGADFDDYSAEVACWVPGRRSR
ncbi:methyltransferase [Brevibacterium sp. 2SA]|uniref:methyltransferase n=1 Tax=Brevibacterium sp. 2SA TaxID=2502198 RepID=UPI0010F53E2B|nr:methyltransferase [Brevibacterium sp. 2SA]